MEENNDKEGPCELCNRVRELTFHHLIPRTLHSNKWFQKNFTWEDMKFRGLMLCKECHKAIHEFIPEKELGRHYNTKELLLTHEKVKGFVEWISRR